jgi:hypothetical protein
MFLIPLEGTPEADKESPEIEDPLTEQEAEARAEVSVKNQLVEILGDAAVAGEFWETHQGQTHDEIVKAATQVKADDTEAGDATEDPGVERLETLRLGKVPARKTELQQGINDMAILGGREDWLVDQLGDGTVLVDLAVADLKTLYAGLQKELSDA